MTGDPNDFVILLLTSVPHESKENKYFRQWMDDLRFYVLFNTISVISEGWVDDYERLCTV